MNLEYFVNINLLDAFVALFSVG